MIKNNVVSATKSFFNRDYQMVLLDWKMPDLSGIETARQLRAQLGDRIPILLISAYDWSNIEAEAREAGINGFISKPLFKSTLYHGLLPFTGQSEENPQTAKDAPVDFTDKRILLAEDNDLNWEIASELLSAYGFITERAENGLVCVEMYEQSGLGYYDAILMDLRMPVMNGYEAALQIRSTSRSDRCLPIIAMTADAFSEDIKKCMEHGMNAHISKPIDMRELIRLLQKHLL